MYSSGNIYVRNWVHLFESRCILKVKQDDLKLHLELPEYMYFVYTVLRFGLQGREIGNPQQLLYLFSEETEFNVYAIKKDVKEVSDIAKIWRGYLP